MTLKYEKNEVPSNAQTCDVLYLTFQRLGDREIAECYPICLCFGRTALFYACKISVSKIELATKKMSKSLGKGLNAVNLKYPLYS